MEHDICRVCGGQSVYVFTHQVIGHQVSYFDCPACGYLQTESPYWLEQAYSAAINDVDTGIMWRNQHNLRHVILTLWVLNQLHGTVVDYAGGYGILVRLMRDRGIDAYWRDKYCENLVARGFEADDSPCALITAFEVLEHFVEPLRELEAMLTQAPAVLVSTLLIERGSPPSSDWWYYGPEHGQHIGFFRERTLAWMANQLGCNYSSDGISLHLFSRRAIPRHWRRLQRHTRLALIIARLRLRPKIMDDFNMLRATRL